MIWNNIKQFEMILNNLNRLMYTYTLKWNKSFFLIRDDEFTDFWINPKAIFPQPHANVILQNMGSRFF